MLSSRHPRYSLILLTIAVTQALFFESDFVCLGQSVATEFDNPRTSSKKGLQVEDIQDALDLNIQHATLNLNVNQLLASQNAERVIGWDAGGQNYQFNADYVQRLDNEVSQLSKAGVSVYVILLAIQTGRSAQDSVLIHPNCVPHPPNRIGGFNTETTEGRRWLSAAIRFLANRWSGKRPDQGRVAGWIVGNEVNSHWFWYNVGEVSMREFANLYEQAVRIVHESVSAESDSQRVYISLEHHWNIRYPAGSTQQCFPGREFLQYFSELVKQGGDFEWHLAFHPYPENLFDPAFWKDESATPDDDTPRITFRNLQVLSRFLARPALRFQGKPRRIILSEQGFHSAGTAESEALQAAAYCYAYRLVARQDLIDAFILHRHIDHPREGGLNLGLRRRSQGTPLEADIEVRFPRKPIYECFKAADTPRWEDAFEFALPIIGISDWTQ